MRRALQILAMMLVATSPVVYGRITADTQQTAVHHDTPQNVLLIFSDQFQNGRLGINDPIAHTPNLDALARENVYFSNCYAATPQCTPSRASMQVGVYPHQHGALSKHLAADYRLDKLPTMGEVLSKAGYDTPYWGKADFAMDLNKRGYHRAAPRNVHDRLTRDERNTTLAVQYFDRHNNKRPFFATVSLGFPHPPYQLVERFARYYPLSKLKLPKSFYKENLKNKPEFQRKHAAMNKSPAAFKEVMQKYYTMISETDYNVGRLVKALKDNGLYKKTFVIFIADHGDMVCAHYMTKKGTLAYEEVAQVPLIVHLPGCHTQRKRIPDLCSNVSLPATVLKAVGQAVPKSMAPSLLPLFKRSSPPANERVFFEHFNCYWGRHPYRAIRTKRWKYVEYYGPNRGDEELYDLASDPSEITNLARITKYHDIKVRLKNEVDQWWTRTGGHSYPWILKHLRFVEQNGTTIGLKNPADVKGKNMRKDLRRADLVQR